MTKFITKTILTSVGILAAAFLLKGVRVESTLVAILVAAVLGLLNSFVRPILIILTIPITILTLGFFLLVINALMVYSATKIVDGFYVDGFWWALLFSLIVSIVSSVLEKLINRFDERQNANN